MNKNYIAVVVAILVIGGGAYYYFSTQSPQQVGTTPIAQTQPTSQQSQVIKTPGTVNSTTNTTATVAKPAISAVSMGTALAASGAIASPSTTFSPTTPKIYAVLSLKNALVRTQLSYIRYYNGKYVDSRVSHPTIDGIPYFRFEWDLKAGQTLKTGSYTLVFYVDGAKAKTINYVVR